MGKILIIQPAHTFNVLEGIVHSNEQQLNIVGYHPVRTYHPTYDLLDMFIEPKAAGSVNGTPAEPGPGGNRVVVDTENKVSIIGGEFSFSGGRASPAFGDPYLAENSLVSRIFGRTFIGRIKVATAADGIFGVFPSTSLSTNDNHGFRWNTSTNLTVREGGGVSALVVGSYSLGTYYDIAIVLRLAGAFYFIKGGLFTNWTLVWISSLNIGASVLSGFSNNNAVVVGYNLRIPARLFIPAPLASDSFNRANGALGSTDGAGHAEANGGGELAWSLLNGTIAIVSNKASLTILGGADAIAVVNVPTPNVMANAELTRTLGNAGIVVRCIDATNYVVAYHNGVNFKIDEVIAGVANNRVTGIATYSAGAVGRIIVYGNKVRGYYNNVLVGSEGTLTTLLTGTQVGLEGTDISALWDNFTVMARGTSNEYNNLDLI